MKKTKIVAMGCSWTHGDGLVDPAIRAVDPQLLTHYRKNTPYRLRHCYAGITADHFGLELINMAQPGASLETMRWTLMWYLHRNPRDEIIILAGLTAAQRTSWYDPKYQRSFRDDEWTAHHHSTWISHQTDHDQWYELNKLWLTMCHDDVWKEFNFRQTVYLFDQAMARDNIPVLQFSVLPNPYSVTAPSLLYSGTSWRETLESRQRELNLEFFGPHDPYHPNEAGHKIIADHLIDHIKSCKLLG